MNNYFKTSIISFAFLSLTQCSPAPANDEIKKECNRLNDTSQSVVVKPGEKVDYYKGHNNNNISLSEGGETVRILLCDSATANIKGGTVSHIYMYDSSSIQVSGNPEISHLTLNQDSKGEITGGSFSFVNLRDNSEAYVKALKLQDGSTTASGIKITGGAITLEKGAALHIYAQKVNFSNSKLSGTWADGTKFSFWVLKKLQDDEKLFEFFKSMPNQVVFHKSEKEGVKG